jgi:L-lysine exporter family protein LysE/ArgO
MFLAFIHGFMLALGLILPLGAQNIFVFNQGTHARKLTDVLAAVLAASFCDTLLILLAATGASLLAFSFPVIQNLFLTAGIIFLIWIGCSIWKNTKVHQETDNGRLPAKKQITFALSVSLLNPHAILDTVGVIGTSALRYSGPEKWTFVAACISVSWVWFFVLALSGHGIGKITNGPQALRLINRLSALLIWGIAAFVAVGLIRSLSG